MKIIISLFHEPDIRVIRKKTLKRQRKAHWPFYGHKKYLVPDDAVTIPTNNLKLFLFCIKCQIQLFISYYSL